MIRIEQRFWFLAFTVFQGCDLNIQKSPFSRKKNPWYILLLLLFHPLKHQIARHNLLTFEITLYRKHSLIKRAEPDLPNRVLRPRREPFDQGLSKPLDNDRKHHKYASRSSVDGNETRAWHCPDSRVRDLIATQKKSSSSLG